VLLLALIWFVDLGVLFDPFLRFFRFLLYV
jgi:hypothetical protein